jgi:PAS domain-containing protein
MGSTMSLQGLVPVIATISGAVLAAGLIIAFLSRILRPPAGAAGSGPQTVSEGTVFLFQGGTLADATPAARQLIATIRSDAPPLSTVAGQLARRFPDLRDALHRIEEDGKTSATFSVNSADNTDRLLVEAASGHIRITLDRGPVPANADPARLAAMEDELRILRSVAEDAPQLIWQQDDDATLVWANRAYLALADRLSSRGHSDDPLWPACPIIPDIRPVPDGGGTVVTRVPVAFPSLVEPQWYEVTSVRRGQTTVHFAVDASNIIAAEQGRQKFIQTLTKTFAHLSSGLAIYDRDRRLVLFNPAFLDLTTLPATFLSQRPSVGEVLDRLRDLQMLPEPKDYSSWRDRVAALEAAAVRGTYCETWSLPSGRTYRVTGRPHPDGAIAFLFEDISDEIHLTRHFRNELETAQSILDSLDEAVAVFSPAGTLTMNNAAYVDLWGRGTAGLTELGLSGEIGLWQSLSQPTPVWDRLRDSGSALRDRAQWQESIRTNDGRSLLCRFQPLAGGAALIAFRPLVAEAPRLAPGDPPPRPRAIAGS